MQDDLASQQIWAVIVCGVVGGAIGSVLAAVLQEAWRRIKDARTAYRTEWPGDGKLEGDTFTCAVTSDGRVFRKVDGVIVEEGPKL